MKYCAFLRGVNVKGTAMKMADVCRIFEEAGAKNPVSVLATGNIIFSCESDLKLPKAHLEKALNVHYQFENHLFILNETEIEAVFQNNPFESLGDFHTYVFVSEKGFEKILLDEFKKCSVSDGEKAKINGQTFYWQVPKGSTLDSDFGKILGRKAFKDSFTSRNINTFEKIIKKINS